METVNGLEMGVNLTNFIVMSGRVNMAKNKRYVVETSISMEVSLKDNLTKKYIFSIICENIDEFEPLITEVMNVCAEMNKLWEQTQRFEDHNKLLMNENNQLKSNGVPL